jgi:hypothetical protein
MADSLGVLALPVSATALPVGDPIRKILGSFLQAAIRKNCNAAWSQIGGGTDVVMRVETNDPNDNTFVTTNLPCLAMLRDNRGRRMVRIADDIRYRESRIVALWVPSLAVQIHKANRESMYQAIEAAVDVAVERGRVAGWVNAGDTTALSAVRGSHIDTALNLLRPIAQDVSFEDATITVEIIGAESKKYPCLKIAFNIWERAILGVPADIGANKAEATIVTNADTATTQTFNYPPPE